MADTTPDATPDATPDVTSGATPDVTPGATPGTAQPQRPKRRRVRRTITWVLIVVVSLLVPLSVVTAWSVTTMTNTDRYVETLAPLAREKVVTSYVAVKATNKLFDSLQVETRIADALPKKADFVAPVITNELRAFVLTQVTKVLQSTWFHNLWDKVNRRSHDAVIDFLSGKQIPAVKKTKDVVVDVTPVLDKAITELNSKGVTVFNPLQKKLKSGHLLSVPIATQQQVQKIRSTFNLATKLGWALAGITLALLAVALAVAVDRRKALLRAAVGSSIALVVFLGGLRVGRTFMIQHTQGKVSPEVTATVFDTLVRYLQHGLRVVLLVALLIAIVMWFIGPSSWARAVRSAIARAARWVWHQVQAVNTPENRSLAGRKARATASWCATHASGLRIVGAVVAGAIILFGGNLSPGGVFWTAVGYLIYLALLQLVLVWARRLSGATAGGPPPGPAAGAGAGSERAAAEVGAAGETEPGDDTTAGSAPSG